VLPQGSSAVGANRADRPSEAVAATLPINRAQVDNAYGNQRNNASSAFATAPAASPALRVAADELGNVQRTLSQVGNTAISGSGVAVTNPAPAINTPGRRSNSSGGANPSTVPTPQQDALNETRRTPATKPPPGTPNPYLSAEEEKVQLFVKARERAAKVQGLAATPVNLLVISYLFGRLTSSSCLASCKCYFAGQSSTCCHCGSATIATIAA